VDAANPQICVEFDEIKSTNRWQSVVVTGLVEELTQQPQHAGLRNTAYQLLNKTAVPEGCQGCSVGVAGRSE